MKRLNQRILGSAAVAAAFALHGVPALAADGCGIDQAIASYKRAASQDEAPSSKDIEKFARAADRPSYDGCTAEELASLREAADADSETDAPAAPAADRPAASPATAHAGKQTVSEESPLPAGDPKLVKLRRRVERAAKILQMAFGAGKPKSNKYAQAIKSTDMSAHRFLLGGAKCIVVIPRTVRIGLFGWGGTYGRGISTCADESGGWTLPQFVSIKGGSWGTQFGASSTDVVMVIREKKAAEHIGNGEFTLGAEAAAVVGPWGRQAGASTNYKFSGQILTYSSSMGLYFGATLGGAQIGIDKKGNQKMYGSDHAKLDLKADLIDGQSETRYPDLVPFIRALKSISAADSSDD